MRVLVDLHRMILQLRQTFKYLLSPESTGYQSVVMASPRSNQKPPLGVSRRTGRYLSATPEEGDESIREEVSTEMQYRVHVPPTPDNQPMDSMVSNSPSPRRFHQGPPTQQFVPSTLFTGGHKAETRGRILDKKSSDYEPAPKTPGKGNTCSVGGCDQRTMRNENGKDSYPCSCSFKICRDCYSDAMNINGKCPGCKEEYNTGLEENDHLPVKGQYKALPSPEYDDAKYPRVDTRLSVVNNKPKNGVDFDPGSWLYETRGTYGYGNAVWPKDEEGGKNGPPVGGGGPLSGGAAAFAEKKAKPLTRKLPISAGTISPYRFLALLRLVVLGFYLSWRIRNPNRQAMWLWGMSVVCEIWFAFSWILDQVPKLNPVNRSTDLAALKEKFEKVTPENPEARSDLPGIDVFVSTADPEKEPPLVTANTIFSILAAEYPVEKLAIYLSDDGGALLTFEALAETASFARIWVPFCRKHDIEPRNPEAYFMTRGDPTRGKLSVDFVKDRRRMKREYDEFKVRINGLPEAIRRRSDAYNAHEEARAQRAQLEAGGDITKAMNMPKATWMADGSHWPGTWITSSKEHSRGDHAGIIQVMLAPPGSEPVMGNEEENLIDVSEIDVRLPMLVYVSREKRPGYDHNKKAGAMNALVRTSAIMSNGPFILNLDCDHYIFNSLAFREAMCFMLDRGGDKICYVQFPQRFEGVDPNDRYANRNTVFFDVNMRALDGLQGPVYVGTGTCFRRMALYGFDPPREAKDHSLWNLCCGGSKQEDKSFWGPKKKKATKKPREMQVEAANGEHEEEDDENHALKGLLPKSFGDSLAFVTSIPIAEFSGRPLGGPGVKNGRPPGSLTGPREPLDAATVAAAIEVISCFFEERSEWGQRVGWIYGSVTEDVVTGFRMHNRGWRSVYCVTKRDAFRGTVPINLTDRLHQVLRWATGSVEIFFSKNNALFAGTRMKLLQRIAYLNVGVYPFTSIFLIVYCFLPAMSLFSGEFIVETLSVTFLAYLLTISVTLLLLALLEVRWSQITLEEWWRNEQFWVIGGTSAHLAAVLQGLLKVVAGVEISFTLTSKAAGDEDDEFAELYAIKWSSLMIPPITIMLINIIAIAVAVSRTIYSTIPQWSKLVGGVFFSVWVLLHLYPFAKGLMGRRGRTSTVVFVWAGLLAIVISLLWVTLNPPSDSSGLEAGGFQFP
ncbi:hypothetical protein R1sor_021212 [Riccia sorocarpa]|uniref:Uncharacterized protein n=1 Tax=Riccia sorocarpa TaxID=122646 RepID=A0ABD3GI20_9MARC